MWMFFAVVCVNRVLFGVAAFAISCFGPGIVFFILGFIWRQASKFEIKHHGFKKHKAVKRLKKNSPKNATKKQKEGWVRAAEGMKKREVVGMFGSKNNKVADGQ